MEHRMKLAKRLLSPKGILICAIDDYEVHNVRHLLDEVFGQENRLGTIVVVHNPRGRNDDRFIATMHEYMLIYAKDFNQASINFFPLNDKDIAAYNKTDGISNFNETGFIRTGNNSLRTERPNLYYPIYYNILKDRLQLEEDTNCIKLLPINGKGEERTWRWGKETFQDLKDTELFVRQVKGEYKIFKKRRITNIEGKKPKTVWTESKYDASSNGIMLLQEIFDGKNPFPYPKSFYALLDTLQISTSEDSIILDFFAGSGTTLHATMSLNATDGGNRQCILVTNNENNICEEVTYETE
jgi:adenine-specific DNA-methyltransferase